MKEKRVVFPKHVSSHVSLEIKDEKYDVLRYSHPTTKVTSVFFRLKMTLEFSSAYVATIVVPPYNSSCKPYYVFPTTE